MRAGAVVMLGLAVAACGAGPRPDLRRLYEFGTPASGQPPVIVIPGILGSKLRDPASGEEIWPGPLSSLVFGAKEHLALPFDPTALQPSGEARPDGLFEAVLGSDFYGEILHTLEHEGGDRRTTPGEPVGDARGRRYYVFAYDWRQDNVRTAAKLDAFIEQVRRDYGDPQLKVDIVAHSMGGLVTHYFLRYGAQDVLPILHRDDFRVSDAGAAKVRTAILLGTPNLGSANSLHGFIEGAEVGLRRIPTEVLATMPSAFQLFPHPINDWLIDINGEPLDRDLFDVEIWRRFEWSVFSPEAIARLQPRGAAYLADLQRLFEANLERARRFVWSLSVRPEKDAGVRIVVFGGDCSLTPARLLVEEVGGDSMARLHPEDIAQPRPGVDYGRLMLEPGDSQVTKPSLLAREKLDPTAERHRWLFFPLAYSFFLCEEHQKLTGNMSFQDNLLNVLLSRERPWDAPDKAVPGGSNRP